MDTMISEKPTTGERVSGIVPRTVLLSVGDHACEALLVAATEGTTRFVAGAPGDQVSAKFSSQSPARSARVNLPRVASTCWFSRLT